MHLNTLKVLKTTFRFLLIGPPIGAILIALPLVFTMQEEVLFFLLVAIPGSYVFGAIPAILSGISFSVVSQLYQPRVAILACTATGTAAAAIIGNLYFHSIAIPFTVVALVSSVITSKAAHIKFF